MKEPEPVSAGASVNVENVGVPVAADQASAQRAVAPVASVVEHIGRHVHHLALLSTPEQCSWLYELSIPSGWEIGRFHGPAPLSRIALCGREPETGWHACETVSAFTFTGTVPKALVRSGSDCTLRDLDAESVITYSVDAPDSDAVVAVRSSGFLTGNERRIWAQYSTYVASSPTPGGGLLIEHVMIVDAGRRAALRLDIDELTDTVHAAFLDQLATVGHRHTNAATTERSFDGT
jgi:hypothetical protein